MKNKLISIVIPAYNEEECIDALFARLSGVMNLLPNYDFEVIIVENGSHDKTYQKLLEVKKQDARFKILKLSKNFGADGGITAGLHFAKGDAAILTYADLEDPPELILDFVAKWEEGYKHVFGITKKRQGSFIRKFNSRLFYAIVNKLTNNLIPKNVSDFRLMDKQMYQEVNALSERNRFLRGMIASLGFKSIGIPYDRSSERAGGISKASTLLVLNLALRGIFAFTTAPLKIASILGIITSIVSFFGIVFFSIQYLFFETTKFAGFGTIICAILLLFGIVFIMLGIMGEYVGLIYNEVKKRPIFIVEEFIN
jgi:glycosyltransferase involved in cell wall biosynthesis